MSKTPSFLPMPFGAIASVFVAGFMAAQASSAMLVDDWGMALNFGIVGWLCIQVALYLSTFGLQTGTYTIGRFGFRHLEKPMVTEVRPPKKEAAR